MGVPLRAISHFNLRLTNCTWDDNDDANNAMFTWDAPAEPAADWDDVSLAGNFDDSLSSASVNEVCNLPHFSSLCAQPNGHTALYYRLLQ